MWQVVTHVHAQMSEFFFILPNFVFSSLDLNYHVAAAFYSGLLPIIAGTAPSEQPAAKCLS